MTRPARLSSSSRRGAALIIALVILAGLLMLGLPFLFTQSSSLSGTRTFAQNQQALLGQDSAENLGIALAASTMAFHLQASVPPPTPPLPVDDWSSLYWGLRGQIAMQPHLGPLSQVAGAPVMAQNPNHVSVDLRQLTDSLPLMPAAGTTVPGSASLIGVALEDESGKLDPNYLDVLDWAALLGAVGIIDWPADATQPAIASNNMLAQALAQLRFSTVNGQQGMGRITYLEQLMSADPRALFSSGTRGPLTRVELEQLRPHLSLANRAAGRAGPRIADPTFQLSGTPYTSIGNTLWSTPPAAYNLTLIDLGTLIASTSAGTTTILDSLPPVNVVQYPVTPNLVGDGTTLVVEDKSSSDGSGNHLQIEHIIPANQSSFTAGLQSDWPVAIAATPALNLHQADLVVLTVMNQVSAPLPAVSPSESPIPDSLAGATSGLTLPGFVTGTGDFLGSGHKPAFSLLDPLSSTMSLGKGMVLPSMPGDLYVPLGTTINGYSAAADATGQLRPMLMNIAGTIRIQTTNLASLPSSGWAQLNGVRADASGVQAQEFIYYNVINVIPPVTNQATLSVQRGQTWNNTPSSATPFFTDSIPTSLPGGVAAINPPLTITFFGAHELPPLAIASRGVVTVEASATVVDPVGHQVAQRARRVVAQAVPQEYPLEERWVKQSQLHALIASRQGSLLTSFPEPYPRLSDVFPLDGDVATSATLDLDIGLRPATLRTLLNSWVLHDWGLPLNGTQATFLNDQSYANAAAPGQVNVSHAPVASGAALAALIPLANPPKPPLNPPTVNLPTFGILTPEGLLCSGSGANGSVYLAYKVDTVSGDRGLLNMTNGPPASGPGVGPNLEIGARQISVWVKPTTSWSGAKPITLLEMRMPLANAGLPMAKSASVPGTVPGTPLFDPRSQPVGAAVPGSAPPSPVDDQQNFWSLYYDARSVGNEQLVLCFANGAIEHPYNYGPHIPGYDPTNLVFDNRSLGSTGGSGQQLAPARPMNRVECRYQYTLDAGTWHLIQVAWTRDTPGAQAIMVDGLVGRDISRSAPLMQMKDPGDHITLPCLVLNQNLLPIPYQAASPGLNAIIPAIQVLAWSPHSSVVSDILPASGYVRIGDEYLSYDGITANSLTNCRRGQRQNTKLNLANTSPIVPPFPAPPPPAVANPNLWWPTVPAHNQGDLIVPGGYRLASPGTQQPTVPITMPPGIPQPQNFLLRGGCTLVAIDGTTTDGKPGMWPGDQTNYGTMSSYNNSLLWGTVAASMAGDSSSGLSPTSDPGPPVTPPALPPPPIPILVNDPKLINLAPIPPGGYTATWPMRGYARVVASQAEMQNPTLPLMRIFYYDNTGGPPPSAGVTPFHVVSTTIYANTPAGASPLAPGSWPTPSDTTRANLLDVSATSKPVVMMISLEMAMSSTSDDPTLATTFRYDVGTPPPALPGVQLPPRARQVQIYDQGDEATHSNAIEWLTYQCLIKSPPGSPPASPGAGLNSYFLVNFAGFPWYGFADARNQRGLERTRGPVDPATALPWLTPLPANSRVLPVQSVSLSGTGVAANHLSLGIIRTGDVLTIAPSVLYSSPTSTAPAYAYGSGTGPGTWQAVVRYAPMDGFGMNANLSDWLTIAVTTPTTPPITITTLTNDTDNELFAFTEELPAAFNLAAADLICWPGWNGVDLSPPVNNQLLSPPPVPLPLLSGVPGLLPWSNAFATNFLQNATVAGGAPGDDRQLYIGAGDDRLDHNPTPVPVMEGMIDALQGGNQQSAGPTLDTAIVATIDSSEAITTVDNTTWLSDTTLASIAHLTIKPQPLNAPPTPTTYGLVLIGGEVFAYQPHYIPNPSGQGVVNSGNLELIGRSLLGSGARIHSGREPMVYLAIGPVAPLAAALTKTSEGQLPLPSGVAPLDAPTLLVSSPSGDHIEFIAAPNGYTAPWLRGLYGTCTPELNNSGSSGWIADPVTNLAPLLIGWWPRYPSALPNAASPQWSMLTPAQQSAMMRSRTYSWASFPLRYYDGQFPTTDDLGTVTVLDTAGTTFDVAARALSSGFDWNRTDTAAAEVALPVGTTPIAAAFLTEQFAPLASPRIPVAVDGAELRVYWRYHVASPSAVPSNKLFALINTFANSAPTLGPTLLRCRAPSKIISVESAR